MDLVYTYLDPRIVFVRSRPVSETAGAAVAAGLGRPSPAPRRRVSFRAVFGLTVLLCMGGAAVLAPQIAPWDPARQMLLKRLRPPMWEARGLREHPLGTDHLGRDILSRILYGGRISLGVGLSAVTLSGLIGVTLGLLAGFHGGRTDAFIMRVVDVFLAIPYILLAMGVVFALGPSLLNVILVMAVTRWVQFARIVRADVLSIREREFVSGARARGSRSVRLLAPPRAAQRAHADHRGGHARAGLHDHLRVRPVLPRPGRPAAHADLGLDALRRPQLHRHRLVARHLPRPRHHAHRARRQSPRRLAPRHPRPPPEGR